MSASVPPPAALILGASGTLGGAVARTLAARGYALGLHAHQHPERVPEAPPGSKAYRADFREAGAAEELAKAFLADFGKLDALVWAAGISRDAPVAAQDEADLREVLAVNLTAPFLLSKALARTFLKQKRGRVVWIGSHAGLSGRAGGAAYAMAQSGLLALAKSLAREWGPTGVQVHAVIPPFVRDSGMGRTASAEFVEAVQKRNVFRPDADPAEAVAAFVANLLEQPTSSGQVFVLDARIVP